jgi:hypothetical protein
MESGAVVPMRILSFEAGRERLRSGVPVGGVGPMGETGDDDRAAALADLLADRSRAAQASGWGEQAAAAMRLAERLRRLRPEDGHLRALVAWFAAIHRGPAASAVETDRSGD